MAWNALVENREDFMEQWTEQLQSENLLEGYRAEKFIEYTDGAEPLTKMDTDFMRLHAENAGPHQGFWRWNIASGIPERNGDWM